MPKPQDEVQALITALEDANYEVKPYSGRGMFGRVCVSVQGGAADDENNTSISVWEIARELFHEDHGGAFDTVPEPRQDQLGLGIVLYWPNYEWPKEGGE